MLRKVLRKPCKVRETARADKLQKTQIAIVRDVYPGVFCMDPFNCIDVYIIFLHCSGFQFIEKKKRFLYISLCVNVKSVYPFQCLSLYPEKKPDLF